MATYVAYHGYTTAQHKNASDSHLAQGYKYISLSIYGPPANPLYAGVLKSGFAPNSQVEKHAMNGTQWQQTFNDQVKQGRGPVMAVATGPYASAVYAAVFETMNPIPFTQTGLGRSDFDTLVAQAQQGPTKPPAAPNKVANTILSWTGIFGTADDPRYIGIWTPNPNRIVWNASRLPPTDDQQWFDASNYQWARQVFSVYSPELDEYVSIYRDDAPTDYVADGALSPGDYQKAHDDMQQKGYVPSCVQGCGINNALITPTFVKPGSTGDRVWSAPAGPAPHATLAGFDTYMKTFMQKNRVRAGALAVVKGTRLVVARGYTYGESGYPVTHPDSIFRIASCSKLITAVAMLQLTEKGLKLSDKIVAKLPFSIPANTPGYNFISQISVDDCLSMISGYDGSIMPEQNVASFFNLGQYPVTKTQRAQAMMQTQILTGAPGTSEHYCNLGYSLLGLVLEKFTSQSYDAYVKASILKPLGVTRARLDVAATTAQPAGAVRQQDRYAANARTVLSGSTSSTTRPFVPRVYGGVDYSTYDAYGGWCMAAVDYAAFLAAMNRSPCPYFKQSGTLPLLSTQNIAYTTTLSGLTLEDPGWARGWSLDKSTANTIRWWGGTLPDIGCYHSLDDNQVAIVAFMNTDMNNIDASYWVGLRSVAAAISDWGTDDFFHLYGLTIP